VRVVLDDRTRVLDGGRRLLSPTGRLLRLAPGGPRALADLERGAGGPAAQRLAATLLEAGAAHPQPDPRAADDVTVVVPVKDRVHRLEVCLAALHGRDVLVVDDGSVEDVAAACERHGARYLRRDNGGPAAARNTAIPLLDKDFVAFLDSDCLPSTGWLDALRGHFEDASVVAVAPRVVGGPRSPLDMGLRPAVVRPGSGVPYVPTAALMVRRSALLPFDESLRYGEDVDLVWRLVEAGGVVRYDPAVVVEHQEPERLADRLVRRYRYGTSAAPLAERHPRALTHLVLQPWPSAVLGLGLAGRLGAALATAAVSTHRADRVVEDVPESARLVADAVLRTSVGVGKALALLGPLAWWAAARDRRAALLLLGAVAHEWHERGRPEDLPAFASRALLDQAAYGAGVVAGCLRHRTAAPLVPRAR
jgi:mycofactocin system glycosyltransferase